MTRFISKIASLIILLTILVNAETRFVSKTGSSTPPYTSWETASDSIQKCINFSLAGDTIYVGNGTYKEKIVVVNKFLTLIGSGWDSCIVDSRDLEVPTDFRAFYIDGNINIKGFHIIVSYFNTGENRYKGSGIIALNAGIQSVIENNKIENAKRGIWILNSHLTFKHNNISNVTTGIRLEAFNENYFPVVDSNVIFTIGNYSNGIEGSFGTSATIRNNYVVGSKGGDGYRLILYPKEVRNNIFEKKEDSGLYGYYFALGEGEIANNFVIGNSSESAFWIFRGKNKIINNNIINSSKGYTEGTDSLIFQYNNAWNIDDPFTNFSPDSTNLMVDPMFVNEDSSDFHLQMFSPLIDKGDPSFLDRDGSRSDIGVWGSLLGESYAYQDLAPRPPVNITAEIDSGKIFLNWNKNNEADFKHYNIYRDTVSEFSIDSSKLISILSNASFVQVIPRGISHLYYKLTAQITTGMFPRHLKN